MNSSANLPIIMLNFSGISSRIPGAEFLDFMNVEGTNCYCDKEAFQIILSRIAQFPVAGIHLIDSGNYHYVSRIWMEYIHQPFQLLMLDNHTDLQPPAFGGLLSCGGWLYDSLEELSYLEKVLLVGPDESSYQRDVSDTFSSKLCFFSRELLSAYRNEAGNLDSIVGRICSTLDPSLPLYISIDKDVLNPEYARTTWSQGDMSLPELLNLLHEVMKTLSHNNHKILGVDLCGACDLDSADENTINETTDSAIIHLFQKEWTVL